MKSVFKLLLLLLMAVLPYSLFAQGATIVVEYMKVTPGMESQYLEVEKAWKKIHEKRIGAGVHNGWQLWKNVYARDGDPYQYITITWYNDLAHSLAGDPEGFWEENMAGVFTEEESNKLWEQTVKSRTLVDADVNHNLISAENNEGGKYILVNRMSPMPGIWNEYIEYEWDISKPLYEEAIRRGHRSHWGLWQTWPYNEGDIRFITVDGYKSLEQMSSGEDLLPVVHPGKTWDEVGDKFNSLRVQVSVELWELVDFVFPEAEEE